MGSPDLTEKILFKKHREGASLVSQRWRIWLPFQKTQVPSLVREHLTRHGATGLLCHNYWACVLQLNPTHSRAWAPQREKLPQREARAPWLHSSLRSNKDQKIDLKKRNPGRVRGGPMLYRGGRMIQAKATNTDLGQHNKEYKRKTTFWKNVKECIESEIKWKLHIICMMAE